MDYSNITELFLDPYAVEGDERAKRFAYNYDQQEWFGVPGLLEQCAILREVERTSSTEQHQLFCEEVTEPIGSWGIEVYRELGDRYQRWEAEFGSASFAMAIFWIISSRPEEFERMMLDSQAMRYMEASQTTDVFSFSDVCPRTL